MNQEVAIVRKYPFGLPISFQAKRQFSVFLELHADFVADRLYLARIRSRTDHEEVGERRYSGKVENLDLSRLF